MALLVATAVLVACSSSGRSESATPSSGATTATTSASSSVVSSTTSRVSIPPDAKQCEAASVVAGLVHAGVATGHMGYDISLTNNGPAPCLLQGYPGVEILAADGAAVTTSAPDFGGESPALVLLQPSRRAQFMLMMSNETGWGFSAHCVAGERVRITLPSGVGEVYLDLATSPCSGSPTDQPQVFASGLIAA